MYKIKTTRLLLVEEFPERMARPHSPAQRRIPKIGVIGWFGYPSVRTWELVIPFSGVSTPVAVRFDKDPLPSRHTPNISRLHCNHTLSFSLSFYLHKRKIMVTLKTKIYIYINKRHAKLNYKIDKTLALSPLLSNPLIPHPNGLSLHPHKLRSLRESSRH